MHDESVELLADMARQVALKAVLVDSRSGDVLDVVEFPNSFITDELIAGVRLPSSPEVNFQRAVAEFTSEHPIEELLGGE